MNRKQIAYLDGRLFNSNIDKLSLVATGLASYHSVTYLSNLQTIPNIVHGIFFGICVVYFSPKAFANVARRFLLHLQLREIKKNRESYPLENADNIIIDDSLGLERLIEKTMQNRSQEWGTALKAYNDKGRAIVYHVVDPKDALKKKLLIPKGRYSLIMDLQKARIGRYNGYHHFHVQKWFGADNFAVNLSDRCKPLNWINLLSFNMPYGPEIIGFNNQFTYIPTDKTKRTLVRATPKQIMEYLSS